MRELAGLNSENFFSEHLFEMVSNPLKIMLVLKF